MFAFGFVAVCLLFPRFVGGGPSVVALASRPAYSVPLALAPAAPCPVGPPPGPSASPPPSCVFLVGGVAGPCPVASGPRLALPLVGRRRLRRGWGGLPSRGLCSGGPLGLRAVAFVPFGARSPRRPLGSSSAALRRAAAGRRFSRAGSSVPPRGRLAPPAPFWGCSSAAAPSGPLPRRGPSGGLCFCRLPAPPVGRRLRRLVASVGLGRLRLPRARPSLPSPSGPAVALCRLVRRGWGRCVCAWSSPPPPFPLPLRGRGGKGGTSRAVSVFSVRSPTARRPRMMFGV